MLDICSICYKIVKPCKVQNTAKYKTLQSTKHWKVQNTAKYKTLQSTKHWKVQNTAKYKTLFYSNPSLLQQALIAFISIQMKLTTLVSPLLR